MATVLTASSSSCRDSQACQERERGGGGEDKGGLWEAEREEGGKVGVGEERETGERERREEGLRRQQHASSTR